MVVLSLVFEGPARDLAAWPALDVPAVSALFDSSGLSTLAGFGVWGI